MGAGSEDTMKGSEIMTILVTNDDGDTVGLRVLLQAAKKLDAKAYAIIPHKQRSAISKALTLHKAIRFHPVEKGIYDLNGTPADVVLFALYGKEVPKPTLVLSGINFGDNASTSSILSSGTLGACWEAALAGVPAIAFSMYKGKGAWRKRSEWTDAKAWGDARQLKKKVAEIVRMLRAHFPGRKLPEYFFSVNLPAGMPADAKIVWAKRTQRLRFKTVIHKRLDPAGVPYYWIGGDFTPREKGTDLHEVAVKNNIVISAVSLELVRNLEDTKRFKHIRG